MKIGYFLSCEEYTPAQLLVQARAAEKAGFEALWISDHFHPWNDEQGQSPFVWSMIGAISQVCDLPVTTAVTCPTVRIHPAVIAQAAATSAVLLEGRFVLGVGTGEALNESVLGDAWPEFDVRMEMLEESVELIRDLWKGDVVSRRGRHYASATPGSTRCPTSRRRSTRARSGRRRWRRSRVSPTATSAPRPTRISSAAFKDKSGGKPAQAGCKVAWADTRDEGVDEAHRLWANAGLPGELAQILPTRGTSSRPRSWSRGSRRRRASSPDRTSRSTSTSCGSTPTRATTRSTSPTWAATTSR